MCKQLAFVCSQTDLLNQEELARNLKLDHAATKRECALKRNEYATQRIILDFQVVIILVILVVPGERIAFIVRPA